MHIRPTNTQDYQAIYKVIQSAFDNDAEVQLVQHMHTDGSAFIDLVAEHDNKIIGHIVISKITMTPDYGLFCGAIAPICVAPAHQRTGVGKALMETAIQTCKQQHMDVLFVLGDPVYYGTFGFHISHINNAYSPEYFQHLELTPNCLHTIKATATYADAFQSL